MSNLIKFLKKYQLIIFLALLAGILLGFKVLVAPTDQPPTDKITPSPKSTKTPQPPTSSIIPPTKKSPSPTLKAGSPTPDEFSEIGITEEEFMEEILTNFPLSPYLPYPNKDYAIRYTAPLELEVSKKGTISAEDKQEVLNWIENQGVDPDSHEIKWKVKE